ncbi:MAG: hypothetical protein R3282_08340 [Rhodothermales bacterium]|nr:hypothetical protein [Rhodothermales bacterium]
MLGKNPSVVNTSGDRERLLAFRLPSSVGDYVTTIRGGQLADAGRRMAKANRG